MPPLIGPINSPRGPLSLNGPIRVGDGSFAIQECPTASPGQGHRLWPCSVLLARWLIGKNLGESLLELGCGLGLVGISVADRCQVTMIERDLEVAETAADNLVANGRLAQIEADEFSDVDGPCDGATGRAFDSIVGSEVLYPAYDLDSIAALVSRCWTRRGPCVFFNWVQLDAPRWEQALEKHGLSAVTTEHEGEAEGQALSYLMTEILPEVTP